MNQLTAQSSPRLSYSLLLIECLLMCNYVFIFVLSSKLKTKMYIALQSLEIDLTKMMHMFR